MRTAYIAKTLVLITTKDTVAEWLRRGPAKLVGSARASSILVGVENSFFFFTFDPILRF